MAQFTGDKAESIPSRRVEGEVSEPSMTLDGIARVTVTDGPSAPGTPLPGSSPELAIWIQALEGLYAKLEGGRIDTITNPVSIGNVVSVLLNAAQLAALLPKPFPLDADGRLPVRAPNADPLPGDSIENPINVQSLDGSRNQVSLAGGELSRITEPVNVRGAVTALLGDPGIAILGLAADMAAIRAILGAPPRNIETPQSELDTTIIEGPVTTRPTTTGFAKNYAVIVSTSAVLLAPSDPNRKSIVVANNSTGSLYIGGPNVASSGVAMGMLVPTLRSYSDSGDGAFTGELWGVYSASAVAHNVAISDRS